MSIAEANRNDALTGMNPRNRSSQKREGRSTRAAFADGSQEHPEVINEEVEGAEHRDKMSKMMESMDQAQAAELDFKKDQHAASEKAASENLEQRKREAPALKLRNLQELDEKKQRTCSN
eukprot:FR739638.1.p2 GENE.FR739638.1~~FR739638.1.p2  ORF type:complete len:120 (+),score=18.09 FR739638.1:582-941(+)